MANDLTTKKIINRTGGYREGLAQISVSVSWEELTAMTEPCSQKLVDIFRRKALALLGPERGGLVLFELEQGRMPALVVRSATPRKTRHEPADPRRNQARIQPAAPERV